MEDWHGIARLCGFEDEKSMLTQFYVVEGLPVSDIAERLNCGPATIANRLTKHQIPKRSRGGANNSQIITKRLFRLDQRRVFGSPEQEIATLLDCSRSTVYKYKRSVTARRFRWNSV